MVLDDLILRQVVSILKLYKKIKPNIWFLDSRGGHCSPCHGYYGLMIIIYDKR